jgi:hypothetical protein
MIVNSSLVPILKDIHFSDRFINLSNKYTDFDKRLVSDDFNEIEKSIQSFEYNFKFNKSENFFKLIENIKPYKIQFNVVIQRGIVEFIIGIEKDGERLKMGGSVCGAVEFLIGKSFTSKPIYKDYEDLQAILKEAFSIYEDFKAELLKQEKAV